MGGVGKAVATRLAADSYRVALLYHTTPSKDADTFVRTLSGEGHSAHVCDITEPKEVDRVIAQIQKDHQTIYGCVHTATGPIVRKGILDLDPAEFLEQYKVDVLGGFTVFKAVAPLFKAAKEGVIIGITSMFIEPNHKAPRMGAYVPAKFALRGLLRELSSELAPYRVRVNALAPSFMKTNLSSDLPEKVFEFAEAKNPMKSLLTPELLAGVVSFLCSDEAQAITGVSLPVAYGEVENL